MGGLYLPGGRGYLPGGVPAYGGGGVYLSGRGCIPACTEADTPFEQNDWQTPVKILPCSNFVADGNYVVRFLLTLLDWSATTLCTTDRSKIIRRRGHQPCIFAKLKKKKPTKLKQESIPVGCVPPALHRTGSPLQRPPEGRSPPPPEGDQHGTRQRGSAQARVFFRVAFPIIACAFSDIAVGDRGTPAYEKSWIRHCIGSVNELCYQFHNTLKNRASQEIRYSHRFFLIALHHIRIMF